MSHRFRYSVVIPVLDEAAWVRESVLGVSKLEPEAEVIVVDGGSRDDTVLRARTTGARVMRSARGRGIQCNVGAQAASGDVLLFLHADTALPEDAFARLEKEFRDPKVQVGTFRLSFRENRPLLRLYSAATRFDSVFTRFGDQCIVVRREFFESVGGFPDWPLFEDVHFLRKARRLTKIRSFPATVTSSARRFVRYGILRTQIKNGWLLGRYLLGTSASVLSDRYYERKS